MAVTMGTADAVLKEVYEPKVQRQLNDETPMISMIETSSNGVQMEAGNVGGRYVKFPIHIARSTGLGARREMEDIPLAGNQSYTSAQVNLTALYARIQLTGQVYELADSNVEAFINVVDDETSRIATDAAVDLNRQSYSDGSGRLGANNTTTGAATVITLSAAADARNFQVNEYCDVFTAAAFALNVAGTATAAKAQITITAVDLVAGTITYTPSITLASGDVITRNGNVAREIVGLAAIVANTGILYNVNSSTVPLWKSQVDANAGTLRPFSESILTLNVDQVRVNGGKTNLIVMGLGVKRAYVNLLQQNRQVVNTTSLTGGASSIAFTTTTGDIKIMDDWTAPPNTVYGLSTKDLTLYQSHDWQWWKRDGGMFRWIPNKDAVDAFMSRYLQLGCHRRNTQFVIKDLVEG